MTDSRRIMKNTIYMAFRMGATMVVTLYTSRVVLQQLGVDDFGIYSVIGGLTLLMNFFSYALDFSIQRYMNVELATHGDRGMQAVFATSWGALGIVCAGFLLVAEVCGLWYINNWINIPAASIPTARIVFQFALLIACIEMARAPFNAMILAKERMSFYAIVSIVEVLLKLTTAILLAIIPGTKLLIYMGLLTGVAILIDLVYVRYSRTYIPEIKFSVRTTRRRVLELGKFTVWNTLGTVADISYQQGTALILNFFYGVAFNATVGIANQVKNAVLAFTRSIQTAANPQLMQTMAAGETEAYRKLFVRLSKISFLILLFVGTPVILNAHFLLSLWLPVLPPQCTLFVQLMVVFCISDSLTGPMWASMQTSGHIARFQTVISLCWICCLPITYAVFRLGMPAYYMMVVIIGCNIVIQGVRIWFTSRYCGFPVSAYLRQIILPLSLTTVVAFPIAAVVTRIITNPVVAFFAGSAVWLIVLPVTAYFLGCTTEERAFVRGTVSRYFKSFH